MEVEDLKIISVLGITNSGKTMTIENIIKELKKRSYTVGSVKNIHFEAFKMDVEGTNTYRHREAGATQVTAWGKYETDILFQEKLSLQKILSFYDHDYVILEGVNESWVPKILTAHDIKGIEDKLDNSVVAISGRISAQITEYKGLPAINSLTNIEDLVNLIEEKSLDINTTTQSKKGLLLKIDDNIIEINTFVQKILMNSIEAIVKELDGYKENGDIEICIKK